MNDSNKPPIDPLDWLLKHEASLERYYFLGNRKWRVVVSTGHGQIAFGDTPREAMESAIKRWGNGR